MKKRTLSLLLGGCLVALSATASPYSFIDNNDFYFQVAGSYQFPTSPDGKLGGNSLSDMDFSGDLGVSGAFGRYFNDIRIEVEASWRTIDTDFSQAALAGVGGDLQYTSFMVNMLYEGDLGEFFYWYAGAGIGAAFVNMDIANIDDDETVFAYQFLAGIGYNLTDRLSMYFGYRFFGTTEMEFSNNISVDPIYLNTAEIGMRFRF